MNQEPTKLVAKEEATGDCAQLQELSEAQLAFIGGGIGDVVAG
jgi:hypothetical protein